MSIRIWCLLWCFISVVAHSAQLKTISAHSKENNASLHFAVSGTFTYKVFVLNNPYRIVIDLGSTSLGVNLNQLNLPTSLVKQVRSGKPDANTLRLVVDVSQALRVKSSFWQENGSIKGVQMDLEPITGKIEPVVAQKPKPVFKAAKPVQAQIKKQPVASTLPVKPTRIPIRISHNPSSSIRDVLVVLDAGHGGKDPGARGPHQSREKDVVLAITLKLKRLIDKQPGMRAVLTRSGDYYVGLRNRLDIARKYNGDIFVSVHADAFNNPHSHGASVFALSQSGATSEAARWIAEKENYSELGGVNLGDLDDQNGVVRSVLIDLSQTSTINSSLQMGSHVLGQLNGFTALHNTKVEQARFMVLKSPDIPSILVETGFISNPKEERNLTSQAYQNRLSQAIFQGIKNYFWDNPPQGTRIELMMARK
ncbi:MAG: N-acetylmuramoyl-L-alanine amidase [Legionella sp.]